MYKRRACDDVMQPLATAPASVLKHFAAMGSKTENDHMIIAEGTEVVRWLLLSQFSIRIVVGKPSALAVLDEYNIQAAPCYAANAEELSALVGFSFTRGVIAIADKPCLPAADDAVGQLATGNFQRILALDNIHDAANVGTLIRSARCLGIDACVVSQQSADPLSRRSVRTSVGHAFHLPVFQYHDPLGLIQSLQQADTEVFTAHRGPASIALEQLRRIPQRWCLFLGNEDRGVQPSIVEHCNQPLAISMAPDVDSLNVAAAGAILMHHLHFLSASP